MVDLHRHDEHSLFDGSGKSSENAKIAKNNKHYTALGISNHGDMAGLVSHYFDCKEEGIKPILGNEVYFQPYFKKTRINFHLCLFVKNLKGYENLNRIVTYANLNNYYYKAIVDFNLLIKYHEGLICTSACIGGFISQMLAKGKKDKAYKCAEKLKSIFGDDFYIEIQPYKLTEKGLQESINEALIILAKDLGIKCILTSDSHFGKKEDFMTYLKMHEIAGHRDFGMQYKERFMPTKTGLINRFTALHGESDIFKTMYDADKFANQCIKNLEEIENKVEDTILEDLPLKLPIFDETIDSKKQLLKNIKIGLKEKGKYNEKYLTRCKEEYEVIVYHGFEDYFLMVQEYVTWAKNNNIEVGMGRGSVCNCLIAYALDITEVDSLLFNLDFRRFLRKDKKKFPDIDMDFETDRRDDVIEHLLKKYPSHSARICSYGLYKVDNLLNDLFKVCGLGFADKADPYKKDKDAEIKIKQNEIKKHVKKIVDTDGNITIDNMLRDSVLYFANEEYDHIIEHFCKLYKKIRFYGTHAAGVAISGEDILKYTAIERRSNNVYTTSYDLSDIEKVNVLKFDMLGLRTMSILKELRDMCDMPHYFDYNLLNDNRIYEEFNKVNTDGIFQFESKGGKKILQEIGVDNIEDIIAASALNRPGPLSLGMVDEYANNKKDFKENKTANHNKENIFFEYAKESYGTFIYQEQVLKICVEAAGMEWGDADKIMKLMKRKDNSPERAEKEKELREKFVNGMIEKGYDKKIADNTFNSLLVYTFNRGHAVGYTLISIEQMYYKIYHNLEFWFVTLKYANDTDLPRLSAKAVYDGCIILIPHVNGCAYHNIVRIDNERCIREGTVTLKAVGIKAAQLIEKERKENGKYLDYEDFMDRIDKYKSTVNTRVISVLKENGALEFDKKIYFDRCKKYNSALYSRNI